MQLLFQNNLTELKSFGSPPAAVVNVTAAVMVLLSNKQAKVPKDRSWKAAKVMMGKVGAEFSPLQVPFIQILVFDIKVVKALRKHILINALIL